MQPPRSALLPAGMRRLIVALFGIVATAGFWLATADAPAAANDCYITGNAGCGPERIVLHFTADEPGDKAYVLLGSDGAGDSETVRVRVDWDDGNTNDYTSVGFRSHTYAAAGDYEVTIMPLFDDQGGSDDSPWLTLYGANRGGGSFYFTDLGASRVDEASDVARLTRVVSFGELGTTSFANAFNRHRHLTDVPDALPSTVTDIAFMFRYADAFNDADINDWDTSGVTRMDGTFKAATAFNRPLADWDVGAVTSMTEMFEDATLFDQPLDAWESNVGSTVASVTTMEQMFDNATAFNGSLAGWDVSSVTDFDQFLRGAVSFNGDVSNWTLNSTSGINMNRMFEDAASFNQPLTGWDVSDVTDFSDFLKNATSFDQDLASLDVSGADDLDSFFEGATSFNGDVSNWTFSSTVGIDVSNMFEGATTFDQPLGSWDVSKIDDMNDMFRGATSFDQDLSGWDVSNVGDMEDMFNGATAFDQDLSGWELKSDVLLVDLLDCSGLTSDNYDATLIGWAALDPAVNGRTLGAEGMRYSTAANTARATLVGSRGWTIDDAPVGTAGANCVTAVSVPSGPALDLACSPSPVRAGGTVTCDVRGGEPNIDILWRAAYNPVIDSRGVTLGADGSGSFAFTVPAAALGEELTVELVDWSAPESLGVVAGPTPERIPAGGGPSDGRGAAALSLALLTTVLSLNMLGGARARVRGGWSVPSEPAAR